MDDHLLPSGSAPWPASQFKLEKILANALRGQIKLLTHLPTNTQLVAKSIPKSVAIKNIGRVEDIYNEINLLNLFNHLPFCIQTHGTFHDQENIIILLEYAQKGELFNYLNKLTIIDVLHIMAQLLLALTHIHSTASAHRDLSPENLLIKQDGSLRITDFAQGITDPAAYIPTLTPTSSATITQSSRRTISTTLSQAPMVTGNCGKLYYRPPEVYNPKRPYDPQALDIHSCGVIFYMLITGSPPWRSTQKSDPRYTYFCQNGASVHALLHLFKMPGRIPPQIAKLIDAMLSPDPRIRPTAQECLDNDIFNQPWTSAAVTPSTIASPRQEEGKAFFSFSSDEEQSPLCTLYDDNLARMAPRQVAVHFANKQQQSGLLVSRESSSSAATTLPRESSATGATSLLSYVLSRRESSSSGFMSSPLLTQNVFGNFSANYHYDNNNSSSNNNSGQDEEEVDFVYEPNPKIFVEEGGLLDEGSVVVMAECHHRHYCGMIERPLGDLNDDYY